ncbi:synaptotagmin-2 [Paragonimus westermani]|uniref:Synaptotagmin-2 n=1 Tax=Paragonimus westermani TaxID=34504 RepID=A0A5J4N4S7_9TREM|nr:synaptotagmin-2 [Paragonimus westermani]KAA3670558.1 synaptotagmin-2 [Paragonimus westermani]
MNSTQHSPIDMDLATAFHVPSLPVAIFLVILISLICISAVILIVFCVISKVRRLNIPKMKRKRLNSVYLNELDLGEGEKGAYGQLSYMFMFEKMLNTMHVVVLEATDLHSTCDTKTLDTYASIKLATSRHGKLLQLGKVYKTEVQRRTRLPRWNYRCSFEVTELDLAFVTLVFEILDYDSIGQDRSLGRLTVPLSNFKISEYTGIFYEGKGWLQAGEPRFEGLGELCVGLSYQPNANRLEIFVYEARQLTIYNVLSVEQNYRLDIQVELRYRRKLLGRFSTNSKTELVNPYFNEKHQFSLKEKFLNEAYVLFRLRVRRQLGRSLEVAALIIGPNSELTTGAKHWGEMVRSSPRTHVMWHTWIPKSL